MITVLKEITDWGDYNVANGTYHVDGEGKLVAYQPPGGELKTYKNPLMFSKSYRKFEKISEYPEPEDINATVVTGSNGNKYVIRDGKCSCSGFRFRGKCKHINMV